MSSSYSRPGIRQTDANAGAPRTRQTRIKQGAQAPAFGDRARFVNQSDPALAGRNAGQTFAEISSFLNEVIEPATKIADDVSYKNAQKQVGDLLASNPNLGQLYDESPEAAQNKIRSLSGRAQDLTLSNLATSGAFAFSKSFPAAIKNDELLQQPTTDENREAQTKRYNELRSDNLGLLKNLPPEYLAGVTDKLAGIEGQIKGELEGLRLKTQKRNAETQLSTTLGSIAVEESATVVGVDAVAGENAGAGAQFDGLSIAAEKYNGRISNQIDRNLASGNANPTQVAQRNWAGAYDQIVELLNDDQYEEARSVLNLLKAATKEPIMVGPDGKTNFWDIPITGANGSASSIQEKIRKTETVIDSVEKTGSLEKTMDLINDLRPRLLSKDAFVRDEARQEGLARLREAEGIPLDTALQAAQLLRGSAEEAADPTTYQERNLAELRSSPEYRNSTVEQRRAEILQRELSGEITGSQAAAELNVLANAGDTSEGLDNDVTSAQTRATNEGAKQEVTESVIEALQAAKDAGLTLPGQITGKGGLAETETQAITNEAWNETRAELDKRLAAEPNKPIERNEVVAIYKQKIEEATQRRIDEYGQQSGRIGAPTRKTKAYVDMTLGKAKSDSAAVMGSPVEMFPQSFKDEFETVKGKPLTNKNWKEGFYYLASRLDQVKDEDGKPVYGPDGITFLRNAYKQATKSELVLEAPVGRNDPKGTRYVPGSKGMPTRQRVNDQKSKQKDGDEQASAVDFTGNLLLQIAGTVLPGGGSPASAALMNNPENLQAMAEVWTGRKPLSLKTPSLPQLSATAPVEVMPLAMRSINHPFALAIGIAEGTRTPDGGVTRAYYGHRDPGNGVRNQGNFSAQQGQATPQIADQQWLGKLTRQQMNYEPLLARAGIQRGTHGYNRLMFNILDLTVQAPAAVPDFVAQTPKMIRGGLSIESIAKARADSFYSPSSGRLDAPGFGNNYSRLFSDQRSRAGVWDLRSRL